jgi:hypothetical protein
MVIEIPHTNLDGCGADMRSRLVTWESRSKLRKDATEVILDFTKNKFIEPWALAQFVAWALWLRTENGISVSAKLDDNNPSNLYVQAMGIQQVLESGASTDQWDESRQNTGLHVIKSHADVTRFVRSVSRLGADASRGTLQALQYGMAELSRNVVQHAESPMGGVAIAQYFPDARAVQISVSDRGRGIAESLRTNYQEIRNHLDALKLAVLPHVTGAINNGRPYSSPDNAGLGLFFTKEFAWRAGGSFWLVSGSALLGVQGDDEAAQHRIYRTINTWAGTSVTLHFPHDGVTSFEDLLELCQELSLKARNASGPAGLDFLDELPQDPHVHVKIADFWEDIDRAVEVRNSVLIPAIRNGEWVILDFEGIGFATQSFVHALFSEPFRMEGALLRLSFLTCTPATCEAIRTVAAYAASYRQSA